jgi:phosphatidylserine decarboxylase
MLSWITDNLLWSQGQLIVFLCVLAAVIAYCTFPRLLYVVLLFFIFSFSFFRNPTRISPQALSDDSLIVSPADGKVVAIEHDPSNGFNGYARKISIFLSPLDVHVNWVPFAGTIEKMQYKPGAFAFAFLPKSSELNERNDVTFKHPNGQPVMVRQIAGTVARRICWWITPGQQMTVGDKFGMIRFGSRIEIFLPENVEILVSMDQRVYGGDTIIGKWLGE